MNEQEILGILSEIGAIRTKDHFVYAAGDHGSAYVNKDAVYAHPLIVTRLCRAIAERLTDKWIDVVIGPTVGGALLAQGVAKHLSTLMGRDVKAAFAEKKDGGGFTIRSTFLPSIIGGKNDRGRITNKALVVEDILTTGSSVRQVVEEVRAYGGVVDAVAALCNRGNVTVFAVGYPSTFFSLINLPLDKWPAASCPLCADKVPVNLALGHGKKFLAQPRA